MKVSPDSGVLEKCKLVFIALLVDIFAFPRARGMIAAPGVGRLAPVTVVIQSVTWHLCGHWSSTVQLDRFSTSSRPCVVHHS